MGHQSYFIWNGFDCRSKGVITRGPAPIVRPEERVRHIEIPGRSGDLTELEGENIYNSYIQTVSIAVHGGYRVREIYRWLRGAGYVTFSGEPDRRQKARIIGAVTLNKHSYNMDWWEGEVQFYCQPLKELLTETPVTITSTGASVRNNGDVNASPLWKVTVNGTGATLMAGGNTIALTGMTIGSVIWIDSETMEVWNADRTATITEKSSGQFPILRPGNNAVTFTNCSSIEIHKRERYL